MAEERDALKIAEYTAALDGVRQRPGVTVKVEADEVGNYLIVSYVARDPANPATRDAWTQTLVQDWQDRRALRFRVRTPVPLQLSVSFRDGNQAGYTQRPPVVQPGDWQTVELSFSDFWFNRFGPPGRVPGAPLDLSNVPAFGFSPVNDEPGEFAIGQFEVVD